MPTPYLGFRFTEEGGACPSQVAGQNTEDSEDRGGNGQIAVRDGLTWGGRF